MTAARCYARLRESSSRLDSRRYVRAQRLVSFGVAGGVSIPQGDLRDAANTGWHALGTVVVSTPMQPLGLRLDGATTDLGSTMRQVGR